MDNLATNKKERDKRKSYSIKDGFLFFLKSNIILLILILIFNINRHQWGAEGRLSVDIFIIFAEPFILLMSIIAGRKSGYKQEKRSNYSFNLHKNEWIGMGIAFVLISCLSLVFLGAGVSYPSTIIMLMLITNSMASFISLIFHPIAIGIYQANVYGTNGTITGFIFKYVAIIFSGINHYVQMVLTKLPLILNKIIAILFVLLLLWETAIVIAIFD